MGAAGDVRCCGEVPSKKPAADCGLKRAKSAEPYSIHQLTPKINDTTLIPEKDVVKEFAFMDERSFLVGHGGPGHALLFFGSRNSCSALFSALDRGGWFGLLGIGAKAIAG
jgi:hypothetical protein